MKKAEGDFLYTTLPDANTRVASLYIKDNKLELCGSDNLYISTFEIGGDSINIAYKETVPGSSITDHFYWKGFQYLWYEFTIPSGESVLTASYYLEGDTEDEKAEQTYT